MSKLSKISFALVLMLATGSSAAAQVIVSGHGEARDCYMSTKLGNMGTPRAIKTCKAAISDELKQKDLAATHTNLGVLLMRKGDYADAQLHYKHAIEIKPEISEAYINYGASLIYSGDYQEAVAVINTAIDLKTVKLPEALFNRAMAYDRLANYTDAYKDLQHALTLRPQWPAALSAIENYTVTTRSKSN